MNTKHMIKLNSHKRHDLPQYADVHFCYTCPECQSQTWLRSVEASIWTKISCISCDHVFKITPLKDVQVTYSLEAKVTKKRVPKHIKMAIKTLNTMNYTREEAIRYIRAVPNYRQIKDVSLLVRQALEKVEPSQP